MVAKILDSLADAFDACHTVAFADLGAKMVLVTNGSTDAKRETLNALCREAAISLGGGDRAPLGNTACQMVVAATPAYTRVFLRDAAEPNDAICCICDPAIDLDTFLPAAQACLTAALSDGAA